MSYESNCNKRRKLNELTEDEIFIESFVKGKSTANPIYNNENTWLDTLYDMLFDIQDKTDTYLNHEKIISDFKKSLLNNREGMMNRCLECQVDMGKCNPRQLCGKTYCSTNN